MSLPPRHARRLVLAGIVGAVSLLLGAGAMVQFRADASWQGMQEQFAAIERDHTARPHRRDPAWGEPSAESAFAGYARAATAVAPIEKQHHQQLLAFDTGTDATIAADTTVRPQWRTVLEPLRAGAHATDTAPPTDPSIVQQPYGLLNLLQLRWVANVGMFEARALLHEDHDVEAARTSLDATTLGLDAVRTGPLVNQMIGAAVLAIGTSMWTEARLALLSPPALDELAQGLERIDRQLPTSIDLQAELLVFSRAVRQLPTKEVVGDATGTWRHGFSERWLLADAFHGYVDCVRQMDAAAALPWPQREALMELAFAEQDERGNPLTKVAGGAFATGERSLRETVATLRLLRMAVDLHRGLDVPPLRDPLADGPIHVTKTDAGTRLLCDGGDVQPRLARLVSR